MATQDFKDLLQQLGDTTVMRRETLPMALAGKAPAARGSPWPSTGVSRGAASAGVSVAVFSSTASFTYPFGRGPREGRVS